MGSKYRHQRRSSKDKRVENGSSLCGIHTRIGKANLTFESITLLCKKGFGLTVLTFCILICHPITRPFRSNDHLKEVQFPVALTKVEMIPRSTVPESLPRNLNSQHEFQNAQINSEAYSPERGIGDDDHYSMETWRYNGTHTTGRDPRLAPLTCRIYGSCVSSNGTLLLPKSLLKAKLFLDRCGASEIRYLEPSLMQSLRQNSTVNADLMSHEAVTLGGNYFSFLLQALKLIMIQDIINRRHCSNSVNYQMYGSDGDRVSLQCPQLQIKRFTPMIVIKGDIDDTKFSQNKTLTSWKWKLLSLIRRSCANSQIILHSQVFGRFPQSGQSTGTRAACFRSIVTTGERGNQIPPIMLGSNNPFFSQNGLSRKVRWKMNAEVTKKSESKLYNRSPYGSRSVVKQTYRNTGLLVQAARQDTCRPTNINIVIYPERLVGSDIQNLLDILRRRIKRQLNSKALELKLIQISESTTPAEMILVMQYADVFIAGSGSAAGNTLYMRPKSVLVEIFPYSVLFRDFAYFAEQLGVQHVGFMARADSETFKRCIQNQTDSIGNILYLLRAWDEAAEQFKSGDRRSHLRLHLQLSHWNTKFPGALRCAIRQEHLQMQRVEEVARAIYDRAIVPRIG